MISRVDSRFAACGALGQAAPLPARRVAAPLRDEVSLRGGSIRRIRSDSLLVNLVHSCK